MSLKNVGNEEFEKELKSGKLLFVDFSASWCGPCQMMAPIVDEIAEEYEKNDKIDFLAVDIDKNMELSSKYSVMSVPTMLFLKDGEIVETMIGARPKDVITNKIEELLK